MSNNPFTDKLYVGKYANRVEFVQALFNKAIMNIFPAKFGREEVRQAIIDFESPEHRNDFMNLDDCIFYSETYKDVTYWLGVTDIYKKSPYRQTPTLFRYNSIMGEDNCIIIMPICNTSTEENTIKSVKVFMDIMRFIHDDVGADDLEEIYAAANYFYRVFGINLLLEENYDKVFGDDKYRNDAAYEEHYQQMKKFIMQDAKYCKVISTEDIKYSKLLGAHERYGRFLNQNKLAITIANTDISADQIEEFKDALDRLAENGSYRYGVVIGNDLAKILGGVDTIEYDRVLCDMMNTLPHLAHECLMLANGDEGNKKTNDAIRVCLERISENMINSCIEDKAYLHFDKLLDFYAFIYSFGNRIDAEYLSFIIKNHKTIKGHEMVSERVEVINDILTISELNYDDDITWINVDQIDWLDAHYVNIKEMIEAVRDMAMKCRVEVSKEKREVDEQSESENSTEET